MTRLTVLLLLALSVASPIFAQQSFSVIVDNNSVTDSCVKQMTILKTELAAIGAPSKPWRWIVACSELAWTDIVSKAGAADTCCAFTLLDKRCTFVRGVRLADPLPAITPGYIVAHELGHIATNSTKEKDANEWAKARGYRWGHADDSHRSTVPSRP
ncbi:MAG TPA: hypothetical protein VJR04_12985 [Terriglobales bacterium]|nr:hypothetical protein [Terriglobales bacterium]